ncbi:protein transport protein bos1 [Scheffersomyces spartinae]|uniref:Protein transport protein BOS1 n=1 Tax=Scheffersomyces spartinae TaxID=45513 RepID=A0A9P8AKN4_9ASCO|nr:protein transport protein bos1 [Scheffersomyces spartinae]KAG7196008.1 protein transport protein bos1 [Scheffersomyces spartinae]
MNSLYNHGIKQKNQLSKELVEFEKNLASSPLSLQGSISTTLTAFRKTIDDFRQLVKQNSADDSNMKNEQRLELFTQELRAYTQKFNDLKRQREAILHESNRLELLGRRHHNISMAADNPYEQQQTSVQQYQQERDQMSFHDGLLNESLSLKRGTQQLDLILEMGQSAFDDIVDQNETLRRLGSKFEDSLVTLGVSRTTIKRIEKRARQDKWLFWGSFVLMLVIFYYILKWFR